MYFPFQLTLFLISVHLSRLILSPRCWTGTFHSSGQCFLQLLIFCYIARSSAYSSVPVYFVRVYSGYMILSPCARLWSPGLWLVFCWSVHHHNQQQWADALAGINSSLISHSTVTHVTFSLKIIFYWYLTYLYYYRRRVCVCVCVCVHNLTNFCPYDPISTPNVP